jgi:hypothetical protein
VTACSLYFQLISILGDIQSEVMLCHDKRLTQCGIIFVIFSYIFVWLLVGGVQVYWPSVNPVQI